MNFPVPLCFWLSFLKTSGPLCGSRLLKPGSDGHRCVQLDLVWDEPAAPLRLHVELLKVRNWRPSEQPSKTIRSCGLTLIMPDFVIMLGGGGRELDIVMVVIPYSKKTLAGSAERTPSRVSERRREIQMDKSVS